MPPLIFDVLFISIPVVLGLLGMSRGGLRESVALIGILGGAILGILWREPWGTRLAQGVSPDSRLMQAVVFDVLFLTSTILLGYGGVALLPSRQRTLRLPGSRLAGGILGALNGVLVVGLLIWSAAGAGSPGLGGAISSTRLGPLLSRRLPLILLALAATAAVIVMMALIKRFLRLLKRAKASPQQPTIPTKPYIRPTSSGGGLGERNRSGSVPAPGKVERLLDPLEEASRIKEGRNRPPYSS